MDYLHVIEETVNEHTWVAGAVAHNGRSLMGAVGQAVNEWHHEWHHGASPYKKYSEFPSERALEHIHKESKRAGRWCFDCVLCDIEVHINPILPKVLDRERGAFLKALGKLPPLASPTHDVHWPALARVLHGDREYVLRTMALGACYELWYFDTPHRMGFCGGEAKRLAGEGLLLIRALPRNLESAKLPLFSTARP